VRANESGYRGNDLAKSIAPLCPRTDRAFIPASESLFAQLPHLDSPPLNLKNFSLYHDPGDYSVQRRQDGLDDSIEKATKRLPGFRGNQETAALSKMIMVSTHKGCI
jgi:hypothetical protein